MAKSKSSKSVPSILALEYLLNETKLVEVEIRMKWFYYQPDAGINNSRIMITFRKRPKVSMKKIEDFIKYLVRVYNRTHKPALALFRKYYIGPGFSSMEIFYLEFWASSCFRNSPSQTKADINKGCEIMMEIIRTRMSGKFKSMPPEFYEKYGDKRKGKTCPCIACSVQRADKISRRSSATPVTQAV